MPPTIDEEQWLSWDHDPADLVRYASPLTSPRKVRLFYCACVRRVWDQLTDRRSRDAVEASELFADGLITPQRLLDARQGGHSAWYEIASRSLHSAEDRAAAAAFMCANEDLVYASGVLWSTANASGNEVVEYSAQAALLREIVGNPFRPTTIPVVVLAWNIQTVSRIAHSIYEERAFSRFPVLADALEDAGCDNAEILAHCRGPGPHVRGCWVVDLILGKK
jgi:hypothetical protein